MELMQPCPQAFDHIFYHYPVFHLLVRNSNIDLMTCSDEGDSDSRLMKSGYAIIYEIKK